MIYVALLDTDNHVLLEGKECITSVQELYQAIPKKSTTEIHMTQAFCTTYFTPSGLADLIESAKKLNPYLHIKMEGEIADFQMHKVNALQSMNSVEELTYILQKSPDEILGTIQMLCESYKSAYSETILANSKVASLHLLNSKIISEKNNIDEDYNKLLDSNNDTKQRLHTLIARINHSYQKPLNADTGIMLGVNKYSRILYIKEVTRVRYIDTFIYYLQEILKTAYGVAVRLLVIEPYYAYDRVKLYNGLKPHWSLTYEDVYSADIYMAGYQPSLAEDLMYNPSNADYMIVLDRGGNNDLHITGTGVIPLYTMSDLQDNFINADNRYIISYSADTLHVPHVDRFDDMSTEGRLSKYSSMPITKNILSMLG